ncbi:MAG TPA: DUF5763 domain-containing protein [Candidatus Acidoferrales bacterium]|nr:DUF5763 domain-containing protein [Candidatus Acidoferrales bacterium]
MRDQLDNISSDIRPICLHMKRNGQRCTRPPMENGFCETHGPNTAGRDRRIASRRLVAVVLGLAVLWPFLLELWREASQLAK